MHELSISFSLNSKAGVPINPKFDPVEAGLFFVDSKEYRIFEPVTSEAVFAWLKEREETPIDDMIRKTIEAIKSQDNSARGIFFETLLGYLIAGID